ncbi:hypothetical protein RhiirC2_796016 [Rhizophagus irregularis]|uniref:Uncharacterized protein n=1 Tax=Rhizophagus irregularis TaxID=588596 RepID=A0A2N1MAG7_9GLOM|nr:hypothetical protein RhiirC2_796016 [Rhizophagus irregularis]
MKSICNFEEIRRLSISFTTFTISSINTPDIGNKLAERIWKSKKELNKQKAEIQNPASLENYYSAFPSYLTGFFGNLLLIVIAFPYLQIWFTQVLSSLSRKPKLNQQFWCLLSTLQISGHTDGVIDNIDFKEATFKYGNIFDMTCTSTHTMLKIVFQYQMPFNLYENKNDENQIILHLSYLV